MRNRLPLVKRILLWSLPGTLVLTGVIAERTLSEREELAIARRAMLEGDLQKADAIYSRLGDSFWVGEEAAAGKAIVLSLQGEPVSGADPVPVDRLESYPVALLLMRSFEERRFSACLALAELLTASSSDGIAPIIRASALLELQRYQESAEAWRVAPTSSRDTWFSQRFRSVLSRIRGSAQTLIYDRRGRSIGFVDGEARFKQDPGVDMRFLACEAVKEAIAAHPRAGVRLSVDLDLSATAREALRGYRGSIVMLEPRTGEILVAVSDERSSQGSLFPAFEQLREPASISKLITVTAALRAGVDVNSEIAAMTCNGAERYRGGVLYCAYRAGPLRGLNHAMAVSCNIAFANLGVRIGGDRLFAELRRFGFDREAAIPGAEFGRVEHSVRNARGLADLSIGLEKTDITPVHAALIAATFASQGRMPEPRVIHATDGLLGMSPSVIEAAAGREVITPDMASAGAESMEAVTRFGGTGYGLAPEGFTFALKTGTASDGRTGYHTNYIGFFPIRDPKVAFCVRVTHQRTSNRVRRATVEVTRRLLRRIDALMKTRIL